MRRITVFVLGLALGSALTLVPVRSGSADGPEDFTGESVAKRSFAGKVLEKAVFEGVDATQADFTGARLAGANFNGAILSGANLRDADLTGADLRLARLEFPTVSHTDFSKAQLTGVDLSHVYLQDSRFRGADMRDLRGIGSCATVDFRGADVRGANLMGFKEGSSTPCKWRGAKYDRATKWPQGFDPSAVEAVLYVGDAPKKPQDTGDRKDQPIPAGRDFREEDLSKRKFEDKDLGRASLWNVDCLETVFQRVSLVGADLSGADLTSAVFVACDLTGADLRRARIEWPKFEDCDLGKADLREVDLSRAWIARSKFVDADMRGLKGLGAVTSGDFSGADLRGANLTKFTDGAVRPFTTWKGALYDKWTRWPATLDPVAAGAVLVPEPK